jgi:hypothetical protein
MERSSLLMMIVQDLAESMMKEDFITSGVNLSVSVVVDEQSRKVVVD